MMKHFAQIYPYALFAGTMICLSLVGNLQGDQTNEANRTQGVSEPWQELASKHARILSQVEWVPVADTMPNRQGGFFKKGKVYTGVPYSSVRSVGRYIGFDISLRTFLAAVENPASVLYTENLTGKVSNAACYYGAVCSSFTSYSLQCGIWEVSRRHGPEVSKGVLLVEPQSAQAVQVGDVIYTPHLTPTSGSHIELVTDVKKDESGKVTAVRVDESRPPTTATTIRSDAKFDAHLATQDKQLFRITDLDAWRGANRAESLCFPNHRADEQSPTINRTLLLNLGDWVPYQLGHPVRMHVMDRDSLGLKSLVIQRDGAKEKEILLNGTGVYEQTFSKCGDYTAHVVRPDDSASQACEFAVCDLDFQFPEQRVVLQENWDIRFRSDNIKIIAVYLWSEADSYGRHSLFVSDEQRRNGVLTIPAGLLKKAGTLQVWLIGEHSLGRLKVRKDISIHN